MCWKWALIGGGPSNNRFFPGNGAFRLLRGTVASWRHPPFPTFGQRLMGLTSLFLKLGIALGLGLLVGIEREHVSKRLGGIRTFPMVTILGALSALLAQFFGGWMVAAGLIVLGGLIVMGNLGEMSDGTLRPGLTTEVAMLLMFTIGAYLMVGSRELAVALGSGVAILLHFKGQLHGLAKRLGENDLKAMMQFALISFIILPVLPDRTYGPYAVLNPRTTWLMVVLIVGIGLTGYVAYKFFGSKAGLVLGGILGGLVSSTATTVSYARRTAETPALAGVAAVVIGTASTILYIRILVEIATVAPGFLRAAAPPIIAIGLLLALGTLGLWFWVRRERDTVPAQQNPSEIKSAIIFGLIYAAVIFTVAAVKETFGGRGLFVVAILSGLTDVDAITLSVSQLVHSERLSASDGWRLIVSASLSNLAFKGGIASVLAGKALLRRIVVPFSAVLIGGIAILILWPS
ncbi:MAG: MgtC/SapB family protein [Acidobacteriota bacterium]